MISRCLGDDSERGGGGGGGSNDKRSSSRAGGVTSSPRAAVAARSPSASAAWTHGSRPYVQCSPQKKTRSTGSRSAARRGRHPGDG